MQIEERIRKSWGLFDQFYEPYLQNIERYLRTLLQNIEEFEATEEAITSIGKHCKQTLVDLSIQVLLEYFYEHKETYIDVTNAYLYFDEWLKSEKHVKEVFVKYPELEKVLEQKIHSTKSFLKEIVNRLANDKVVLCEAFKGNYMTLCEVKLNDGDTHNNGKSVATLIFESGDKLMYKPRSMQTELAFKEIIEWLNSMKEIPILKTTESLNMGMYGWQKYIEMDNSLTGEEAKRYAERLGCYLGIFRVLGTTDIHAENILPYGEYPILVDLETLSTNEMFKSKAGSLKDKMRYTLQNSILSTCVLPSNSANSPLDIDISGLGGRAGQKSKKLKYKRLTDIGTDRIRFEEQYIESGDYENQIYCNGEKVLFSEYTNEIEFGFLKVYDFICTYKEWFKKLVDQHLKYSTIRQVLRGTFIYDRYLKASYHPKYLRSRKERGRLINLLNRDGNVKSEEEVRQIIRGDIPYFYCKYEDGHLYSEQKVCAYSYFDKSLQEIIHDNIDHMNEQDKVIQLFVLRNAIMTGKSDIMSGNGEYRDEIPLRKENALGFSEQIAKYITQYAIWNDDKKKCAFFDIRTGEKKSQIGCMEQYLYNCGGIIVFFAALAKETKKEEYQYMWKSILNGIEELFDTEKMSVNTSVFAGYGSLIYIYYNLYKLSGEEQYKECYVRCLKQLFEYNSSQKEPNYDVIGGLAGCIIMLSNIYEDSHDERLKILISQYAEELNETLSSEELELTGFAHGNAGFELAMMKAWSVTGVKKYQECAMLLLGREDFDYIEIQKNWVDKRKSKLSAASYWCHGAPGILLARCYMLQYVKDTVIKKQIKEKINAAIETTLKSIEETGLSHSLCHGKMGNLDILLSVSLQLKDEELEHKTKELYTYVITEMVKDGVRYGIPGTRGIVSFMQGISGIAYSALRNVNPNYPSVLSLEVYGGQKYVL